MSISTDFGRYLPLSTTKNDKTGDNVVDRPFFIIADGLLIEIPTGFPTDFSSYPPFSRSIVAPKRVDLAGAVHDKLYWSEEVSRRRADKIWRMIAIHGDVRANLLQGWASWAGLRLGGWNQWRKYRKGKVKKELQMWVVER